LFALVDIGATTFDASSFTIYSDRTGQDRISMKSGYLYQMYAYLRSQEGTDQRSDTSAGLFLHPAVGKQLYEYAIIQGHPVAFATVDLAGSAMSIRSELRRGIRAQPWL
jgi:5-methylcytosine-specific restriction enzyme subunit McrC